MKIRLHLCAILALVASVAAAEDNGTGSILYEAWNNLPGVTIKELTDFTNYPDHPNVRSKVNSFEAPKDCGDNYGARLSGYIHPPATGAYTFWIASDDNGELWLSTTDKPADKVKIAFVPEWTSPNEWGKFPQQKSAPITLTAGKKYYVEAIMKQGGGGANLSVGWDLPDKTQQRPIPGNVLSPLAATGKLATELPPVEATFEWDKAKPKPDSPGYHILLAKVTVGKDTFSFATAIFLPSAYFASQEPFPVVITLHNVGAMGDNGDLIAGEGLANMMTTDDWDKRSSAAPRANKISVKQTARFIGLAPQCPKGMGFDRMPMTSVVTSLIDEIGKFYRVDKDRVYLTGFSYGGTCTLQMGQTAPDKFAAIVPIAFRKPAVPEAAAEKLKALPVWMVVSERDEEWARDAGEAMNLAMNRVGHPRFKYSVIPAGNHWSYQFIYTDPQFWEWLFSQRRKGAAGPTGSATSSAQPIAGPSTGGKQNDTSGPLLCEYWRELPGATVGELIKSPAVPDFPDEQVYLEDFELPYNQPNNFGAIVRGFVTAPLDGDYLFWVSGDDQAELWLSPGDSPGARAKIAETTAWTLPRQWNKSPSQQSKPVKLAAGKKYYIEARLKDGSGDNHLSVAWRLPDGTTEAPIPGNRLTPGKPVDKKAPVLTFKPALPLPQKPGVHRVAIAVDCQAQQFTIPVRITLPPKFNASNHYPVLLFLHDADAKMDTDGYCAQGPDLEFDTNPGFSKLYPFIGISPQCPRDRQWQQRVIAKSLTLAVQALLNALPADRDRIYATGSGAGATALWGLSNDLPGCFAALAPINACEFNAPGLATKLHDLPVRIIAGVKNGGAYDGANAMSTLLANNEPKLDLIFENEMGNEAAQHHYSNAELYNWLLAHQRGSGQAKRPALFWLPTVMLGLAATLFFASLLMLSNKKVHAANPPKAANPA